jgi:hypothetical protein
VAAAAGVDIASAVKQPTMMVLISIPILQSARAGGGGPISRAGGLPSLLTTAALMDVQRMIYYRDGWLFDRALRRLEMGA